MKNEFDLGVILQRLNEKYKTNVIQIAKNYKFAEIQRIPTGIFYLDVAIGGGVPVGRTTLFYGHKSSGKSHTAMCVVAQAQRMCRYCHRDMDECDCKDKEPMRCVYCDVEGTWSNYWAANIGVKLDSMHLSRPDTAEQAIDVVETLLRSGEVDLIVLDSIAALEPIDELEAGPEKWQQGLQARLMGKAVRKWTSALNFASRKFERLPTLVLTNQIRYKIGVLYGNPETTPGGLAIGFATSVEVKFWTSTKKGVEFDKETGKPLWVTLGFEVTKNKVSPAHRTGEYRLVLANLPHHHPGSVYDEEEIMGDCLKFGIIEKDGRLYRFQDKKFSNQEEILDFLLNDNEGKRKIQNILRDVLGKI